MKWNNVRDVLQTGEAAVEFVSFRLYGKRGWTDSVLYCAMILKKGYSAPVWIPLCDEKNLQTLIKRKSNTGIERHVQSLYSGAKGDSLYQYVWLPLEK